VIQTDTNARSGLLDTRWTKVVRDVWSNRTRSLLVILSITIGVLCVGMVMGARAIILDSLDQQYRATNPASATLVTDPFGTSLLHTVRQIPGVRSADARYSVDTRIQSTGGAWKDLVLFVLPDFRHLRLNRIQPQEGSWPPPPHTILLERTSLTELKQHLGQRVQIEMPNGRRRLLTVSGSAHDLNQPDTPISGINYGYTTFTTLAALGQPYAFNQLDVGVTGDRRNLSHVRAVVQSVRVAFHQAGRRVLETVVPEPGKLWVYDATQSMLLLLAILGVFSLGMSGFLVVNTVIAQITQQIRQVGIMKSVGARPRQIVTMYIGTILILATIALVIGVPLGVVGAVALIRYATQLLDFNPVGFSISASVLALEVAAGIGVPVLAALVPIVRGSRITVREAVTSYGTGGGVSRLDQAVDHLARLPEPIVLGLSNTFRRKGRLVMTVVAMTLGGAIFIAVLSVRASLQQTLADVFGYRNYDVQLTLTRSYPASAVQRVAAQVPGVVHVEGWGLATAERVGGREATANVSVVAPLPNSGLIKPVILQGRWLRPADEDAIVVNADVLTDEPDARVGSRIRYLVNGRSSSWTIVGVVRGVQEGPIAYVSYSSLARVTGRAGLVDRLQVVTAHHDVASEGSVARALETQLKQHGFSVAGVDTTDDQRTILGANFDLIVVFLLSMAILLSLVGGLGLMGTMAINALERTREIGIMRAIGASNRDLFQVIVVEAIVIAALSWALGALVALPLAPSLSAAVGTLFIRAPLAYTFSGSGALIWLVGILALATLASLLPAWNASRLTVRDVLAYE
jgi:putative ABC transport system permease protein